MHDTTGRELLAILVRMLASLRAQFGETKERNPKLLPIGDGFGFLLFFGDLS